MFVDLITITLLQSIYKLRTNNVLQLVNVVIKVMVTAESVVESIIVVVLVLLSLNDTVDVVEVGLSVQVVVQTAKVVVCIGIGIGIGVGIGSGRSIEERRSLNHESVCIERVEFWQSNWNLRDSIVCCC